MRLIKTRRTKGDKQIEGAIGKKASNRVLRFITKSTSIRSLFLDDH